MRAFDACHDMDAVTLSLLLCRFADADADDCHATPT